MEVVLKKWGNSYGFRLPKNVMDELNYKENDVLNLSVSDKQIIIKKNIYDEFSIREAAEKYYGKPFDKLMNADKQKPYDWGEAVGEEIW